MIEIRLHGRGGQGAVTAAEVLAVAAFKDGKQSQAFPKFGPERSGAPVEAYCRIDERFVNLRTQVYNPTHLIVLDPTLSSVVDVTKGLTEDGIIVANSKSAQDAGAYKVFSVDASKIATDVLGKPIVNTAMLGAFAKATGLVSLESIVESIRERFPPELAEKNIEATKRAYEQTKA